MQQLVNIDWLNLRLPVKMRRIVRVGTPITRLDGIREYTLWLGDRWGLAEPLADMLIVFADESGRQWMRRQHTTFEAAFEGTLRESGACKRPRHDPTWIR